MLTKVRWKQSCLLNEVTFLFKGNSHRCGCNVFHKTCIYSIQNRCICNFTFTHLIGSPSLLPESDSPVRSVASLLHQWCWQEATNGRSWPVEQVTKEGLQEFSSPISSALRDPIPCKTQFESLELSFYLADELFELSILTGYHGKLEAASTNTRSSDRARPSIWINSSVFILRLPSCSLLKNTKLVTAPNRVHTYFYVIEPARGFDLPHGGPSLTHDWFQFIQKDCGWSMVPG